ncbi:MAG: hypothetical protein JWQ27_214 [Ferruginibacter sp.]|nr:hypothetical protein [Ferruginibacter sp.]
MSQSMISRSRKQFMKLYEGENWLDETLLKKLETETEETVFTQPLEGVHSVAELVWHLIYWRTCFIKRLEGDAGYRDRTVDEFNFLPLAELHKKGWPSLLQDLAETQTRIVDLLAGKADDFLEELYDGKNTYGYLLQGLIEHDAYHLGQIGLVQKIRRLEAPHPDDET